MTEALWPQAHPVPAGAKVSTAGTLDRATQEKILDATDRLVQHVGITKTSMADVARAAGVARGTLYRYFESRETLFDALTQRTTDRFFAEAAEAMDLCPDLSEQLGEFSKMMIRSIHPDADDSSGKRAAMIRMLANQSGHALRRTARFLRPYIETAHERGEVRENLDIADAGEWLARILLSFTIFQASISFEAGDPQSVSLFVQRYAISGLSGS
jgi:AcrR family transcriptional regulator